MSTILLAISSCKEDGEQVKKCHGKSTLLSQYLSDMYQIDFCQINMYQIDMCRHSPIILQQHVSTKTNSVR